MEFTKDIDFDNNPIAEKETKITYSGYLFQNGSNNVNIVYGFGEEWQYTTTESMDKTATGFVKTIKMKNYDTFNFCFSDENNNWDNNNYFNYISPILPEIKEVNVAPLNCSEIINEVDTAPVNCSEIINEVDTAPVNYSEIINEVDTSSVNCNEKIKEIDYQNESSVDDLIDEILGNTAKKDIIENDSTNLIDKILETVNEESLPEIESLFNDIFVETYTDTTPNTSNITNTNNFVDNTLDNLNFDDIDLTDYNNENSTSEEIERLFNELFEVSNEPVYAKTPETYTENNIPTLDTTKFDLDGIVSDLLQPAIKTEPSNIETNITETADYSLFEEINEKENEQEDSLSVVNSDKFSVSLRKLGYFYKLKKRIRLSLYKLIKSSKDFIKQLGL